MESKLILIVVLIVLLMSGCGGNSNLTQESRTVSSFSAIVFKTDGTLNISQGESESLTVEAAEDLLPFIETQVENGTLNIKFKDDSKNNPLKSNRIIYTLVVKDLTELEVDGKGMVSITDLKTDHFTARINGSAIVSASGKVISQEIVIAGMGHYNSPDMASEATTITDDYGLATIWATQTLNITLTSIGKIYYWGDPTVTKSVSGGGKVISSGNK